ncbi:hypothetical protein LZ30DRAFT_724676 [Colletotrichum cereale]|nr:hypothetical protein LZ30DRAFT_724676 [Colletotrichum cereale]
MQVGSIPCTLLWYTIRYVAIAIMTSTLPLRITPSSPTGRTSIHVVNNMEIKTLWGARQGKTKQNHIIMPPSLQSRCDRDCVHSTTSALARHLANGDQDRPCTISFAQIPMLLPPSRPVQMQCGAASDDRRPSKSARQLPRVQMSHPPTPSPSPLRIGNTESGVQMAGPGPGVGGRKGGGGP